MTEGAAVYKLTPMRSPLPLLALAALCALPAAAQNTAGQFDEFSLSLEWLPTFCKAHSSETECAALSPGDFATSALVLHGLWPDVRSDSSHSYGYCGVPQDVIRLDRAPTWCQMPDTGLTDATRARMAPHFPGIASCLERHEWYKHGACSGYQADDYFSRADALTAALAGTNLEQAIAGAAGQTVDAETLNAAFEKDYGPGARRALRFFCSGGALLEVHITLNKTLASADRIGSMLSDAGPNGTCPPKFAVTQP